MSFLVKIEDWQTGPQAKDNFTFFEDLKKREGAAAGVGPQSPRVRSPAVWRRGAAAALAAPECLASCLAVQLVPVCVTVCVLVSDLLDVCRAS